MNLKQSLLLVFPKRIIGEHSVQNIQQKIRFHILRKIDLESLWRLEILQHWKLEQSRLYILDGYSSLNAMDLFVFRFLSWSQS